MPGMTSIEAYQKRLSDLERDLAAMCQRCDQASKLLTRCLETGSIRVEELRPLWDDIHTWLLTMDV